jgi:hypothetical protein
MVIANHVTRQQTTKPLPKTATQRWSKHQLLHPCKKKYEDPALKKKRQRTFLLKKKEANAALIARASALEIELESATARIATLDLNRIGYEKRVARRAAEVDRVATLEADLQKAEETIAAEEARAVAREADLEKAFAQINIQDEFIYGNLAHNVLENDVNQVMVSTGLSVTLAGLHCLTFLLTFNMFCAKLASCKEHKVYLLEKTGGSAATQATYVSHPIVIDDVLYAGSEQFTSLIESLGGLLGQLPAQVVSEFRETGPHVLGSDKWRKVNYRANDIGNKPVLNQFRADYNLQTPKGVRESWVALKVIVRGMIAKLLGVDSLSFEEVDQDYTKLITSSTKPQPPHLDYLISLLLKLLNNQRLYLAVFPLSPDGMMLQVWKKEGGEGKLLFLPENSILILPGDTVHGGGFMTSPAGNLRGHLYIALNRNQPESVGRVLIPNGNDVYVDYTINDRSIYLPAKCLVANGLVRKFGPCIINGVQCYAQYRAEKVDTANTLEPTLVVDI